MATLVLGVVGRLVLGPIGGIVGTLLGSAVDRRLLGGGRGGSQQANPEIQAASYGEPIPVVRGRMRVSGNIVWAAPIRETTTRSGGGKRGPATASYSYSASFAVVLAARAIMAIGRVWADGKLLRDANGEWLQPVTMRLHTGSERQAPDPLIAAAEGEATAFRGLAYVVFEDLPLAEFGNRLPNLSFELIADEGDVPLGAALADLAASAGVNLPVSGDFPEVAGLYLGAAAPLADALAPSLKAIGGVLAAGRALVGPGKPALAIATSGAADARASADGRQQTRERQRRNAVASSPDAIELGYYDVDRDYQPGLQRARLRAGVRVDGDGLPLALSATAAKQLCNDRVLRLAAGRQQRSLRLPWRYLGILPGDVLRLDDLEWQVRETRFERFVLTLELVRVGAVAALMQPSDPGRALVHGDQAAGPTSLLALDLPPLPGELPDGPRLWIAGAGASAGWRRAGVLLSLDDGNSYEPVGLLPAPVAMGRAVSILPAAIPAGWDRLGRVDVELLADSMWLESRGESTVLAGANLALLGEEIIQFSTAEALGNRRFRLSGLLRGRRGTDLAVSAHAVDERFVLLDQGAMLSVALPLERQGQTVLLRATGVGDAAALPVAVTLDGAGIKPLLPVHLSWRRQAGQLHMSWIAQSRAGFGWPDLADVPIGESRLAFRAVLRDVAGTVAATDLNEPWWTMADQAGPLWLDVAQVGATLGPAATLAIPSTGD